MFRIEDGIIKIKCDVKGKCCHPRTYMATSAKLESRKINNTLHILLNKPDYDLKTA